MSRRPNALDALFRPTSVAVIGASSDPTRIGGRPVRYLKESGFRGAIYPVNPGSDEVQGLRAFRTVSDIPEPVDCAVIALSPKHAVEAARACSGRGVRQIVMFSAGFAEMGDEGRALQAELTRIGKESGMRILGPNCLGAYALHSGAFLTFSGVFDDAKGTDGAFGLVSQSGGYAGEVLKASLRRDVAFGTWVTTGNEADIRFGEVLLAMAEDPEVKAIVGYIEGIRDPEDLIAGFEAARRIRKPVLMLKVGRTSEGAAAAASHTASLAGEDKAYDVIFREFGVYRARTTPEMLDVAYATKRGLFPNSRDVAIITNSGGLGIQAADLAADEGLKTPQPTAEAMTRIRSLLPNGSPSNPADTTGQVANEPEKFGEVTDIMVSTGLYGATYVNIGLIGGLPFLIDPLVKVFAGVAAKHPNDLITVTVTAPPEVIGRYEAAGLMNFEDPSGAVRAIAAMSRFREAWDRPAADLRIPGDMPRLPANKQWSEVEAKALLASIGLRSPKEAVVADAAAAAAFGQKGGGPFAVKVVSPDLLHKSDVGGVTLDVAASDLGATVKRMDAAVRKAAPAAHIEGWLVGEMISGGVECIVGIHKDPVFGPMTTFGLGGITVELYGDVTTRRCPVNRATALDMIGEIKGAPLLTGWRGRPACDLDALADAIVTVSNLAAANAGCLRTIEINPLLVLPKGKGVVLLDAVVETGA